MTTRTGVGLVLLVCVAWLLAGAAIKVTRPAVWAKRRDVFLVGVGVLALVMIALDVVVVP